MSPYVAIVAWISPSGSDLPGWPAPGKDARAAAYRHLKCGLDVLDENGDVFDAVAVQHNVPRDLVVGPQTGSENEAQIVLFEQVADAILTPVSGPA